MPKRASSRALVLLLASLLCLCACTARRPFKLLVGAEVADTATSFMAEGREANPLVDSPASMVALKAGIVGLAYYYQRHEEWPDWPLWAVTVLHILVSVNNSRFM